MNKLVKSLEEKFTTEYFAEHFESQQLMLHDLLPEPLLKQKVEEEAQKKWLKLQDSVQQGLVCFLDQVDKRLMLVDKEKIEKDFFQLLEIMQKDQFEAQSLVISADLLRHLYELATICLEEKIFPDAFLLFQLLTLLMPQTFESWLGLGIAYQEQLLFNEAISAYEKASVIQENHPLPFIYAAECQFQLKEANQAHALIRKALDLTHLHEEFKFYEPEAQRVLNYIQTI